MELQGDILDQGLHQDLISTLLFPSQESPGTVYCICSQILFYLFRYKYMRIFELKYNFLSAYFSDLVNSNIFIWEHMHVYYVFFLLCANAM